MLMVKLHCYGVHISSKFISAPTVAQEDYNKVSCTKEFLSLAQFCKSGCFL